VSSSDQRPKAQRVKKII